MKDAWIKHWPEYLMEAAELGAFMVSASLFTILLYHPSSPVVRAIAPEFSRRILMGTAMGLTAILITYSPWGKQSGAHMNPAFTLTFLQLGKVAPPDAFFYIVFQFAGGIAGVAVVAAFAGRVLAHPSINYVATLPGSGGVWVAFLAEATISFGLFLMVLFVSNQPRVARFTGLFAGVCVALFIIFESPFSGMSMNPARTLGSAFLPHLWSSLWIYFTAPALGMLIAAEVYPLFKGRVACAKYHHQNSYRCIFCEYHSRRNADLERESTVLSNGSSNAARRVPGASL
jgi:aquaporin Z